jgi:hypothetical protein
VRCDMPVIRSNGRESIESSQKAQLAAILLRELQGDRTRWGPVIFELPTKRLNVIDVIVVWEAWRGLGDSERTEIVRHAYEQYHEALSQGAAVLEANHVKTQKPPAIALILARTGEDVIAHDLLPFRIIHEDVEDANREDVSSLLIEMGAVHTPNPQLRFPTRKMAEQAIGQLRKTMPDISWRVVESSFGPIID